MGPNTEIFVSEENTNYAVSDDQLVERKSKKAICTASSNIEELHVLYGVTTIAAEAFSSLDIKKVFLPDTVTKIEDDAFSNNRYLEFVHMSPNLQVIGSKAFSECGKLKEIDVPASVSQIGDNAFKYNDPPILVIEKGSYGEKYALTNKLPYRYANVDKMDWLKNDNESEAAVLKKDRDRISKQKQDLEIKINEQRAKIKELPVNIEIEYLKREITNLDKQKDSLGIFKGKEKRNLQAKIESLYQRIETLEKDKKQQESLIEEEIKKLIDSLQMVASKLQTIDERIKDTVTGGANF